MLREIEKIRHKSYFRDESEKKFNNKICYVKESVEEGWCLQKLSSNFIEQKKKFAIKLKTFFCDEFFGVIVYFSLPPQIFSAFSCYLTLKMFPTII